MKSVFYGIETLNNNNMTNEEKLSKMLYICCYKLQCFSQILKMKTKKIRMVNYLNKQTAFQIGAMWKACGYNVVYVF